MSARSEVELRRAYADRVALVTGGFGFIGSNLVPRLHRLGAHVRILGRGWPPDSDVFDRHDGIRFFKGDIRDEPVVEEAVRGCDFIFHLAGKSGASTSNQSPLEDLDVNCRALLLLLDATRRLAPESIVAFPSSRLVYAPNLPTPVAEHADTVPISIYGAHKLAAESYLRIFHREHGLKTLVLRITNPYGPYQRAEQRNYGVINQFIYQAVRGEAIALFGDGDQLRDYVHVDDVVEAMLRSGASESAIGQTFNVGSGTSTSLATLARLIVEESEAGRVEHIPWPDSEARVETGNFCADVSLIERVVGWKPQVALRDGVREVITQLRRSPHLHV